MLNHSVIFFLAQNGCVEINPIHESNTSNKTVGYHYKVIKGSPVEVRQGLRNIFSKEGLNYSFSEYNPIEPRNDLLIWMNENN